MLKELAKNGDILHIYETCGFAYKEKEWTEKYRVWFPQHHICNIGIAEHAVPLE